MQANRKHSAKNRCDEKSATVWVSPCKQTASEQIKQRREIPTKTQAGPANHDRGTRIKNTRSVLTGNWRKRGCRSASKLQAMGSGTARKRSEPSGSRKRERPGQNIFSSAWLRSRTLEIPPKVVVQVPPSTRFAFPLVTAFSGSKCRTGDCMLAAACRL